MLRAGDIDSQAWQLTETPAVSWCCTLQVRCLGAARCTAGQDRSTCSVAVRRQAAGVSHDAAARRQGYAQAAHHADKTAQQFSPEAAGGVITDTDKQELEHGTDV